MGKFKSNKKVSEKIVAATLIASMVMIPSINTTAIATNGGTVVQAASQTVKAVAQSKVSIVESKGDLETAYAEWAPVSGATGYNVYYKEAGAQDSQYKQIDTELIRQYSSYFRADVLGLKEGNYTIKVAPVMNGKEDASKSAVTDTLSVKAHAREGFAFSKESPNKTSSGGYNDDGTVQNNAQIIYLTSENANTVTADVITNSKGTTTKCTGIVKILAARQKGIDKRPLIIRMVGEVKASDISGLNGKGYLQLKGCYNVTLEGVGEDATINGWGLLVRGVNNVEVRNLGIMLFPDDGISLDTDNTNVWVHNNDIFYGTAGGDADQAKGDGSSDVKGKSDYVTLSYNHYYDSGKCSLCGMDDSEEFHVTYHHNWFDHSDSRHPRIRVGTIHIYNNYFDGNSKYGVGVTKGSSAFVEGNFFRDCKSPMLTSRQGSDVYFDTKGTFSGEPGGMIKAYNNHIEGERRLVYAQEDGTQFDAYLASSREEKVPASYKTVEGGNTYNNFDTAATMYDYNIQSPEGGSTEKPVEPEKPEVPETPEVPVEPETPVEPEKPDENVNVGKIEATGMATGLMSLEDSAFASVVYASPNGSGSNDGSYSKPLDLESALQKVANGQAASVLLQGGTYSFDHVLTINNSGTANAYNVLKGCKGAKVVLDFSSEAYSTNTALNQRGIQMNQRGIQMNANYWYIANITIKGAADNGMMLSGSHNVIERCIFDGNRDTGLQVSRRSSSVTNYNEWPSYNTILNCTSKNNCDPATYENADGFAAKLTCGDGNVFDGCIAHNNSDDGWDLYAKTATGPIGVVTIRNCIAMRNGATEDGTTKSSCDGNGFKLGGSGVGTPHVVTNCIAIENLHHGFTDNNNPSAINVINCTAFDNNKGGGKNNFSLYRCKDAVASNCISYTTNGTGDKYVNLTGDHLVLNNSKKWYKVTNAQAVDTGSSSTRGEAIQQGVAASDFISTNVAKVGTDFDKLWRNEDGTINTNGVAMVSSSSEYSTFSTDGAAIGARFSDSNKVAKLDLGVKTK